MNVILRILLLISSLSLPALAFPSPKASYGGGGGVGRLILDDEKAKQVSCHYDMVLVERVQKRKAPADVEDGMLYVPDDDLPRLHLCKVLSVGPGREEENGSVAPMLDNLQPGDLIISKHPWGIGPKDEELSDGTKLSYMRYQDVAAVISGGLVSE
jgi:co-chaperonin GroES (HSP10)